MTDELCNAVKTSSAAALPGTGDPCSSGRADRCSDAGVSTAKDGWLISVGSVSLCGSRSRRKLCVTPIENRHASGQLLELGDYVLYLICCPALRQFLEQLRRRGEIGKTCRSA